MTLTLHLLLLPPFFWMTCLGAQCSGHRYSGKSRQRTKPAWTGKGLWRIALALSLTLKGQGDWEWETFQAGQIAQVNSDERRGCREEEGWNERLTAGKKELAPLDLWEDPKNGVLASKC